MQKILNINITVIGLGLIGGSYAMAFKEINNGHVWGVDTNENTLKKAAHMKIIDEGYCDSSAHIPIEKSDVIIIAVYPQAAVNIIEKNAKSFKKEAIITDVLGIKGNNINIIQSILNGYDVEFIGGHPMAGKESSGFEYASKDIFKGANYILTPTEKNKKTTIDYMEDLIRAIGFENISIVTPEKHDKLIAVTSQLPHVIALSLINSKGVDKNIKNFVGGSFKDESRVASINPELWCELFLSNKDNLLKSIDEFQESIADIKEAIENDDSERLKTIMKNAAVKKGGIKLKTLNINLADANYNIYIKNGIIDNLEEEISKVYSGQKIVVITDENIEKLYYERLCKSLKKYDLHKIVIKPGEKSKSIETLTEVYSRLAEVKISRSDLIIAFGGGVVGDLGGFAAATFLRGISYIQIPTSLLAQIDSSIGGKVAVDLKEGKNLVGNFYHPKAVFIDPTLLKTLSTRFLHDGMGEVIKYGAIRNKELFYKLMNFKDDSELLENIEDIIYSCCSIKKAVVENDEKDNGERMILNFGHTIGHAVEEFFNYEKYTHGEGVAYGMYAITKNSEELGLTEKETALDIKKVLEKYNLSYNIEGLNKDKIIETAALDKKTRGDFINIILIKNIGECFIKKIKKSEMDKYLKV